MLCLSGVVLPRMLTVDEVGVYIEIVVPNTLEHSEHNRARNLRRSVAGVQR